MHRFLIIVALAFPAQPLLARECGDALPRKNRVYREVQLHSHPSAPAFYARTGSLDS